MIDKIETGDVVRCHIKNNEVVACYATEYDCTKDFTIIHCDLRGYYIRIPSYLFIKDAVKLDSYNYKNHNINKMYIDDYVLYITDLKISKIVSKLDGKVCKKCDEFYPKSEANQEDGSMICWNCRKYHTY